MESKNEDPQEKSASEIAEKIYNEEERTARTFVKLSRAIDVMANPQNIREKRYLMECFRKVTGI